jgi:D-3-phosphoglycerate dehydrogenase/C-terminal binding protein
MRGLRNADPFSVVIIDSHRGPYLEEPDIEREVLEPCAVPVLRRVHSTADLIGSVEHADAIISWHTIALPADLLARLEKCRGIVRAAVGYDNIDVRFAAGRGIPVCNVRDYGTEEVADHALALMLALVRNLRDGERHVRGGGWDWRVVGSVPRLRGLPLGLVGFGRIGGAVARRAQAFGMDVAFYDPYVPSGTEKVHAVRRCESLPELLGRSRIVSLHVPLTAETRNLIGASVLESLKPDTILVNTSRGEVIDQEALLARLRAERLGGAALDVLSNEPHVPQELLHFPRVLLTPHAAFYSDQSLAELRRKAAETTRKLLLGEAVRDVVNGLVPTYACGGNFVLRAHEWSIHDPTPNPFGG